jgi:hypothetical protein
MNNIIKGSTDFNRVRDGRNSPDAYFDFDLTTARDEMINVAGNSFYIDANPEDGNAVVYFQETDNLRGPTPFYVSPGFIARIPFTQIRIRNTSQPGKKIRVVYGVDTDFQPGSVSQVSFAGEVTINDVIASTVQSVGASGAIPIGANNSVLLAAGGTPLGINLKSVSLSATAGAASATEVAFIAAPAPPAGFTGNFVTLGFLRVSNAASANVDELNFARLIPPNWGLYARYTASAAIGSFGVQVSYQPL